MTTKTQIALDTERFIKFLEDAELLTDEHALTVALLHSLVDQLSKATNGTQFAGLSKEVRATIEALPKPDVKPTDAVADFLNEMAEPE